MLVRHGNWEFTFDFPARTAEAAATVAGGNGMFGPQALRALAIFAEQREIGFSENNPAGILAVRLREWKQN
jgi:hypothetical protein